MSKKNRRGNVQRETSDVLAAAEAGAAGAMAAAGWDRDPAGGAGGPVVRLPACPAETTIVRRKHIDVHLDLAQSQALTRLMAGLDGCKLASGRYVQSHADALRWLLDQIGAAIAPAGESDQVPA